MRKVLTVCAVLGMVLAVSSPALATTVALVPDMLDVTPGSTVVVSVNMSDSPGITMTAMSEIIFYDPAVFTYVDPSVVQGAFLTPVWDFLAAATTPGELRVGSFSGGAVAAGAGTVFTFTLLANADAPLGPSALSWGNGSFLGDGFGYGDAEWNDVLLPSSGASINVTPEPATICLLSLGVLGLLRKRRA
jgi:hypothetical protein